MCFCGYVFLWVCVFGHMCVCGYVYLWVCVFVGMCICGYVYLCVCIRTCNRFIPVSQKYSGTRYRPASAGAKGGFKGPEVRDNI